LNALAQLLLTALKLTEWMNFYRSKKRRHTRAPTLEKQRGTTYFLGATE
jgi:hypothetical protein